MENVKSHVTAIMAAVVISVISIQAVVTVPAAQAATIVAPALA